MRAEVEAFWGRVAEARGGVPVAELALSVAVEGGTVEARLASVHGSRVVLYRCGRLRAVDRIELWLRHLLLSAAGARDAAWSTLYVAMDATVETVAVDDPRSRLAEIVAHYREGWTRPLPFFPETSLAWAEAIEDGNPRKALTAARRAWETTPWKRGDSVDPYVGLCFGDEEPLEDEFTGLAGSVLGPCVKAQKVRRVKR